MKGTICEIQRFALNDGPGIRTLIFFKGCPLKCKWCSNPESQSDKNEIYYFEDRCISCKRCIHVCKNNAIYENDKTGKVSTDRSKCTGCGRCVDSCMMGARKLVGREIDIDDVMNEIKKDIPCYINSGGGVTLSGGEVLLNKEFALEILKRCKGEYIDTAIETSGFAKWETLEKISEYTDHVLIDIKLMDSKMHKTYTGVSNNIILENIRKLDKLNCNYVIRIPLITDINTGIENLTKLKDFLKTLKNLKEINLLSYHTLGAAKYGYLERNYELSNLSKLNSKQLDNIYDLFKDMDLKVNIGG